MMPCRPSLLDLRGKTTGFICRACIQNTRQRPAQPRIAPYSSQTSRARLRTRLREQARNSAAPVRKAKDEPSNAQLKQYLEDAENEAEGQTAPYEVQYFNQDGDNKVRRVGEKESEGLDTSILMDSIRSMRHMATSKDETDAFDSMMERMQPELHKARDFDAMEKMSDVFDQHTASIDARIAETLAQLPKEMRDEMSTDMFNLTVDDFKAAPQVAIPQIPEKPWTPNQRRKITKLNEVLRRVASSMRQKSGVSSKNVSFVYKAYHSARRSLAHGWDHVPLDAWDFIWRVFAVDETVNPHRLTHIAMLAKDMAEARVELNPVQQLLTIEAVFVDGWEAKAMESWKKSRGGLGDESMETFKDFWELGVRMCCRAGDLEQAEAAAKKLLDKDMDARILMPLICTYSERGTIEDQEKAWTLYRQMRDLLKDSMKLSDYDQIVSYFLTTNHTENALHAFVDMMTNGEIDLKKQKYMPSVVANKFFLGKWLKRLIGAGDLDGAYSVVEYMRTKGVSASPIHLNGLIGAWQRSGGADNAEKAENLAWKMIDSRVAFVKNRKIGEKPDDAAWPRATLETFSVLAENYRIRELSEHMSTLWKAFSEAEMSANAFMMNQLLESYCQAGEAEEAVALYQTLVKDRGIKPDAYTFSALWKTLGVNRHFNLSGDALINDMGVARQLFAETVSYASVFEAEGMDGQLARKMLHTFRRLKDHAAVVVTLSTLRQIFNFYPPEPTVLEMAMGVTKLTWEIPRERRRLMLAKQELDKELMKWADNDPQKLEGEARGQALYEYLTKKYWPSQDSEGAAELVEAAKEMGVYEVLNES